MNKIAVIGSSNIDMVVKSSHLPLPGETILGGNFFMNQGGKGANQAIAVKRLGGNLIFVAKLGNDVFGKQTIDYFHQEEVDTKYICIDEQTPSGVALINVDQKAENCIVVSSGANMTLSATNVDKAIDELSEGDFLLMQLEIPLKTVEYAAKKAFDKGVKVVLNPAPACELPKTLYPYLYLITPNEIEAPMLAGKQEKADLEEVADRLLELGVKNVVVTLGADGCFVKNANEQFRVPAFPVKAVDTTAAGDTFNGALCVAMAEGDSLTEAVRFASKASSIAVTRQGAQKSIPYRSEIIF